MRQRPKFLWESVLIDFVAYAVSPCPMEQTGARRQVWLKARLFHCVKNFLPVPLGVSLAADLDYPPDQLLPPQKGMPVAIDYTVTRRRIIADSALL